VPKLSRNPGGPGRHPVATRVVLATTAALVAAVLAGLAKGLSSLKK